MILNNIFNINLNELIKKILKLKKIHMSFLFISFFLYLIALNFSGASLSDLLLFIAIIVLYLVLPGFVLIQIFSISREVEKFTLLISFMLGLAFIVISYIISISIGNFALLKLTSPVFINIYLIYFLIKKKFNVLKLKIFFKNKADKQYYILFAVFSLLLIAYTFGYIFNYPKASIINNIEYDFDDLWHIGNANAFKMNFLPLDIHFSGLEFRYHFLYDMLLGILSIITNISAFDIKHYYIQPVFLFFIVFSVYKLGDFIYKDNKQKILFIFIFIFLNGLSFCYSGSVILINGNFPYMIINNSNSMSLSLILTIAFVLLILAAYKERFNLNRAYLGTILITFVLITLSKGSTGLMILSVMWVTGIFLFIRKQLNIYNFYLIILLSIVFFIIYLILFAGSGSSLIFLPGGILRGSFFEILIFKIINIGEFISNKIFIENFLFIIFIPLCFFIYLPFQSTLYLLKLIEDLKRFNLLTGDQYFIHGMALSGIIISFFSFHPAGGSHAYFIMTSSIFISILAVDKYFNGEFFYRKPAFNQMFKKGLSLFKSLALISTASMFFLFGKNSVSSILDVLNIRNRPTSIYSMTKFDEEAMIWLKNNSNKYDIFATNRLYRAHNDARFFYYTALSERQAFIEGYSYLYPSRINLQYGNKDEIIKKRIKINNEIFSAGNIEEIRKKTSKYNISFLIISKKFSFKPIVDLKPVFENNDVVIYKI